VKIYPNKSVQSHIPASHGGRYSIKNTDSEILDFSSSVNPLGCHPGVKRYLKKHLNSISEYPDSNSLLLRGNLNWYTGIPKKQIVVVMVQQKLSTIFAKRFSTKTLLY